jgi:type-F conjugative transfer system pilin assembly protein TrbC
MLRILKIALCLLIHQISLADSSDLLKQSAEVMERASEYTPDSVQFSDKVTNDALKESHKALSKLDTKKPVLPSIPKLDLLNIPTPSPINIGKLAQQGQGLMGSIHEQTTRYETQVLVFVSSSMPDTTVIRYLHQTRDIGAALVFRGLVKDSMKDMQHYLAKIVGDKKTNKNSTILIDPTLFDRFSIKQVPVTVVTESEIKPCLPEGCPTPVHHKVSGDVSLSWALGLVSRQIDSATLKSTLRPLMKDMERL